MAAALLLPAAPAAANSVADGSGRHCVVEVVEEVNGVLLTGPERCYETRDEARADASQRDAESAFSTSATISSSNTIGVHYTGTYFTGSSITIVGTVCGGGVWYPTGSWNNNISSSEHHCGGSPTRFYDASSCSGTFHAIYSDSTSLSTMNDRTSCVRYG